MFSLSILWKGTYFPWKFNTIMLVPVIKVYIYLINNTFHCSKRKWIMLGLFILVDILAIRFYFCILFSHGKNVFVIGNKSYIFTHSECSFNLWQIHFVRKAINWRRSVSAIQLDLWLHICTVSTFARKNQLPKEIRSPVSANVRKINDLNWKQFRWIIAENRFL